MAQISLFYSVRLVVYLGICWFFRHKDNPISPWRWKKPLDMIIQKWYLRVRNSKEWGLQSISDFWNRSESWLSTNVSFFPLSCYNPLAFAFVRWFAEYKTYRQSRGGFESWRRALRLKIVCHKAWYSAFIVVSEWQAFLTSHWQKKTEYMQTGFWGKGRKLRARRT